MRTEAIKIIMVGTTHPGNIGAAARAMLTMSCTRLVLVDPQCEIDAVAYARASGADEILDRCEFFDDLSTAIADCELTIAASARRRALGWPELDPAGAADLVYAQDSGTTAALVFGREHSGLSNEELQLCNRMVVIPANPEFGSLNVASAIQILCYELHARGADAPERAPPKAEDALASSAEVEAFFEHLQASLQQSGFLDPGKPGQIMPRLRRLFLRAALTRNEINILRGTLSAFDRHLD